MGLSLNGIILAIGVANYANAYSNASLELKEMLFTQYDTDLRPECGVTNVTLVMALRQILYLEEPTQQIALNVWMRMYWEDCRLVWNDTEFGIKHLQVPYERIWIPDITLFDSTTGETFPGLRDYKAKILSNGKASYVWPTVVSAFCKLDVTNFPFDEQTCAFVMSSWIYDGTELDWLSVSNVSGDLYNYQENAEWIVEKYVPVRHAVYYACCPQPFVDLTFNLHLKRRALHYVISLVFPCILISALTLLGFLLPVESGEKVSLQVTVMLSLSVFLLIISDSLPPSSDSVPLIGIYFACTLILVTVSCVCTVAVIHTHFVTSRQMPKWIKTKIIGRLGKYLYVATDSQSEVTETPMTPELKFGSKISAQIPHENNNGQLAGMSSYMKQQVELLEKIEQHFADDAKDSDNCRDWNTLAAVMDRFFFLICSFFLIVASITVFSKLSY